MKVTPTDHHLQHVASAKWKGSKAVAALPEDIIDISDDIDDIAEAIVNKSARFWQDYLKTGASSRRLRAAGTESDPINLMDVGTELEYTKENAP